MILKTVRVTLTFYIITSFFSLSAQTPPPPLNAHLLNVNSDSSPPELSCQSWTTQLWREHKNKLILGGILVLGACALITVDAVSGRHNNATTNSTMPSEPPLPHHSTPRNLALRNMAQIYERMKHIPPYKLKPIKRGRKNDKTHYR